MSQKYISEHLNMQNKCSFVDSSNSISKKKFKQHRTQFHRMKPALLHVETLFCGEKKCMLQRQIGKRLNPRVTRDQWWVPKNVVGPLSFLFWDDG